MEENQEIRIDLNWDGMLTVKNIEQVVDLLRRLLGGKRYIFVSSNEFFLAPQL